MSAANVIVAHADRAMKDGQKVEVLLAHDGFREINMALPSEDGLIVLGYRGDRYVVREEALLCFRSTKQPEGFSYQSM